MLPNLAGASLNGGQGNSFDAGASSGAKGGTAGGSTINIGAPPSAFNTQTVVTIGAVVLGGLALWLSQN